MPRRRVVRDVSTEVVAGPPAWLDWMGSRWNLNKKDLYYREPGGVLFHVAIWQHHNGPVPADHHVHHRDQVRTNNALENLTLLAANEHMEHHVSQRRGVKTGPAPQCSEGLTRFWANRQPVAYVCAYAPCGKTFYARSTRAKFCHPNHKAAERRRQAKEKFSGSA